MTVRRRLCLLCWWLCAATASCGSSATEVVVHVESDLPTPDLVDAIKVSVRGGSLPEPRERVVPVAGPGSFPVTVAVVHDGGELAGYFVDVVASKATDEVQRETRALPFAKGKRTRLSIRFAAATPALPPRPGVADHDSSADPEAGSGQPDAAPEPAGSGQPDAAPEPAAGPLGPGAVAPDAPGEPSVVPDAGAPQPPPLDAGGACMPPCPECDRSNCGAGPSRRCTCSGGCACRQVCAGGEDCEIRCEDKQTKCAGTAVEGGNVKLFACHKGATCTFSGVGASNVAVECRDGASCEIDCRAASNCFVKCSSKGACLLRCTPGKNCEFESCDTRVDVCPGAPGLFACGAACP